jgi:transposase
MTPLVAVVIAYLGIDVAQAKLDVVVRQAGHKERHRVVANTPEGFRGLLSWLTELGIQQVSACLEATGSYSDAIARWLYEQGYTVSVLNPAVLVAYRKSHNVRSKTDKLDARLLARYAQEQQPRPWRPLPAAILSLRSLLCRREEAQQMLLQERNRLRNGRAEGWVRSRIEQHVGYLQQELDAIETEFKQFRKTHQDVQTLATRLQTIVGIGPLAAMLLIALIGEIARFDDVRALVSLAGLAIAEGESGTSVHKRPHIDRHGRADLRRILYMCALVAMRYDPSMAAWAARLRAHGKPPKLVIVAVMRKLLHIVYGVWKSGQDYDPQQAFGAEAVVAV